MPNPKLNQPDALTAGSHWEFWHLGQLLTNKACQYKKGEVSLISSILFKSGDRHRNETPGAGAGNVILGG
jgi:hypothetical protein